MQTSEYHSLEEIQARKAELQTSISKDSEQIGSLWHELVTRKLMKTYGSLFSRKKKK